MQADKDQYLSFQLLWELVLKADCSAIRKISLDEDFGALC